MLDCLRAATPTTRESSTFVADLFEAIGMLVEASDEAEDGGSLEPIIGRLMKIADDYTSASPVPPLQWTREVPITVGIYLIRVKAVHGDGWTVLGREFTLRDLVRMHTESHPEYAYWRESVVEFAGPIHKPYDQRTPS